MPAKSKAQRRIMGMAKAIQEGELPTSKSPAAARIARTMKPADLNEFASTTETGLPRRLGPAPTAAPRPQPKVNEVGKLYKVRQRRRT